MNSYAGQDFDVDALLRQATSATLPEQTEARLQKQLDDFRKRMAQRQESGRFADWFKTLPRWAAVAVAAPALILIVVGMIYAMSSRVAFAEVLERFGAVRTIRFAMTFESGGIPTAPIPVSVLEPGKVRELLPAGMTMVTDMAEGKSLLLDSTHKSAVTINRGASEKLGPEDYVERLRRAKAGSEEKLGEREMDGHKVCGFRMSREGLTYTIWADVRTELPVRVVVAGAALGQGGSLVLSEFVYNEPINASLFSLTPPDGYSVQQSNIAPAATPAEADVVAALRNCAKLMRGEFLPDLSLPAFGRQLESQYGPQVALTAEMVDAAASVMRAAAFVQGLNPENDWHYTGADVKLGDASEPVCWWKPSGTFKYRVIYGDLSIRDETTAPPAPPPEKPLTISTAEEQLSLKPSNSASGSSWMQPKAGRIDAVGVSLKRLFGMAYEVDDRNVIINAPLPRGAYDLTVRVPEDRAGTVNALIRKALEARFKYAVRYETRNEIGYTITCPKGPGPGLRKFEAANKARQNCAITYGKMEAVGQTIQILSALEGWLNAPVVEKTGLAGEYDFTLTWDQSNAPESIVAALRDQLGLDVSKGTMPAKTLIIDSPEK
jgi:uncharacterized protein (TIGR03435 family)